MIGNLVSSCTFLIFTKFQTLNFFFFFWPGSVDCRILVPQPRIEPGPTAVKVPSPNHWAVRELRP